MMYYVLYVCTTLHGYTAHTEHTHEHVHTVHPHLHADTYGTRPLRLSLRGSLKLLSLSLSSDETLAITRQRAVSMETSWYNNVFGGRANDKIAEGSEFHISVSAWCVND
jgi:hypothetical protein